MNRPELYHKSVDILYNAYFNDTLRHSNCYACAVGNLVAANNGYKFVADEFGLKTLQWEGMPYPAYSQGKISGWAAAVCTSLGTQAVRPQFFAGEAKRQILSTGYTFPEIIKIEFAFENANGGNSSEDYMFNGLVAVLDCLKKIHEVEDNKEVIAKFKTHRELLCTA